MGLNIGKFLSRAFDPKKVVPIVSSVIGGNYLGALSGAASNISFGSSSYPAAPAATPASYQTPSMYFPQATSQPFSFNTGSAVPVANRGAVVTAGAVNQDIFNALMKLADRVGVRIMNPNAVVRVGRNILAKLLRFARARLPASRSCRCWQTSA